jgi:predicted SprT family Zn-dependent metalloprotease
MTLKSAKKLAKQMMRKHKVSHVFDFSFMDSKTTFGICYDSPDYLIQLSIPYVRLNGKKAVLDTILHEIAHARDILNRKPSKKPSVCQGCGYNNGLYKLIKQNDNQRSN